MRTFRTKLLPYSALLLLAVLASTTARPQAIPAVRTIRAAVASEKDRQAAPNFVLEDSSGKTAKLSQYHGKVVLLDFWATWCTGCKEEIPYFSQFEKIYGKKGLVVVGVSMDEGGWKVVKPWLASSTVSYRMLLGNPAMAQSYGIKSLPDTFLIDRRGRIAATYRNGLVDKEDVETNLNAILAK